MASIDKNKIDRILQQATKEGRNHLLEQEGYELIELIGAGSPPEYFFLMAGEEVQASHLARFKSARLVLKLQSPYITHKTEAEGVGFVANDINAVSCRVKHMLEHSPAKYAQWLSSGGTRLPRVFENKTTEQVASEISASIQGVLITEYITPDSAKSGAELLIGLRWTREFGPVMTAGLGGTDTELFAERFKGNGATVTASPLLTNGDGFLQIFKQTTSYQFLAGTARGRERIIGDDDLSRCFDAFITLAKAYGDATGGIVIKEMEVNPYVVSGGRLVPLDMLCTFGPVPKPRARRPVHKIDNLLKPKTAGVIGVSSKGMNIGRTILRNLINAGMKPEALAVIKPNESEIDGVKCYPTLADLPHKLDMLVLAVDAQQVPELCREIIRTNSTESVILIPGGMREKEGSEGLAAEVERMIEQAHLADDGGPVFVGSNCLGILSIPGRYDTLFIPMRKLPKPDKSSPIAFVSQSGAFMITRMSRRNFKPRYAISYGNQTDLTVSDFMHYLKDDPEVDVLAVYVEGFKDYDGLEFAKEVREAMANGKDVLLYKAGRTAEGRSATSGHTASIAGDYRVCESVAKQVGMLVTSDFTEFEELMELAVMFHGKHIGGNRVFATSNAGYESVGMADNTAGADYKLQMAEFMPETRRRVAEILEKGHLTGLVDIRNPMDLNPMATDEIHVLILEALMDAENCDAVVFSTVPLSGCMQTLPAGVSEGDSIDSQSSLPNRLKAIGNLRKPVVVVIDSGGLYDPMAMRIRELGIPTFRSADRAMAALGRYINYRLNRQSSKIS